jgi:hypothetical protein
MPLINDIKKDAKVAKKMRLPWWGVLLGIIGSTLSAWLFEHFGRLDIALPTLISIGTLGFAVAIKWKLKRRVWFWITIIIIVALHVPLILFVPWTIKWVPAPLIVPFCIADLILMLMIISVIGRLIEGPKTTER